MIKFKDIEKEKIEAAFAKAEELLLYGRLSYTSDTNDERYPIVDALTPPGGSINMGKKEVKMVIDTFLPEILEAFVNA